MSTRYIHRYALVCDGCGAEEAPSAGYESATEARAAAFAKGWKFPHRLTRKGGQAQRTSDVCPACAPSWTAPLDIAKRES